MTGAEGIVRIVLVDDDADVLSALHAVFEADDRFEVVGTAGTGPEAVESAHRALPDVVLLDLRMPGGGTAPAAAIAGAGLRSTLVVLSARIDEGTTAELLGLGVRGVLLKGRVGRDLPEIVLRCRGGEVVVVT